MPAAQPLHAKTIASTASTPGVSSIFFLQITALSLLSRMARRAMAKAMKCWSAASAKGQRCAHDVGIEHQRALGRDLQRVRAVHDLIGRQPARSALHPAASIHRRTDKRENP